MHGTQLHKLQMQVTHLTEDKARTTIDLHTTSDDTVT